MHYYQPLQSTQFLAIIYEDIKNNLTLLCAANEGLQLIPSHSSQPSQSSQPSHISYLCYNTYKKRKSDKKLSDFFINQPKL